MDFLQIAKRRYACRQYQDRKVEPEKLEAILEAGRVAPTGANRQPQRLIVTDHMMLMAASLGLDTLWVCMFKPDAVREEFALPPHVEPVNILFIGYGAGEPASSERHDQTRKPLCETVFHETYGAK